MLRLISLKRFAEAERHCESVLTVFPNDPLFLSLSAEVLMNIGHDEDALDVYQISLSLDARQHAALLNVGAILLRNNQFEEAIPFLEAATELDRLARAQILE